MIGNTTSTILVSDGAECILINKKYFQQHLNDEEAKRLRRTVRIYCMRNNAYNNIYSKCLKLLTFTMHNDNFMEHLQANY